jgi:hypothetical protein
MPVTHQHVSMQKGGGATERGCRLVSGLRANFWFTLYRGAPNGPSPVTVSREENFQQ